MAESLKAVLYPAWLRKPAVWLWLRRAILVVSWVPFVILLYGAVANTLGADPAKALALETGRWSLRFLVLCLLITPLRELTGLVGLAPLRRMFGLFALLYASLHFLVYLLFLLELRWSEIGSDILERPYITVGFVAFLILTALGVTSPKRMVRLLGKRWRPLHRLVYLSAVLSVIHLWWILRTDVFDAVFYGTLIGLLLSYRFYGLVHRRMAKKVAG